MSKGHLLSGSISPLLLAPGSAYIPAELRPFLQSLLGPHSSWHIRVLSAPVLISQILYPSEGRLSPALAAWMHYLAISSLGSQPPPRGSAWEERKGPSESQMPQTCWGSSLEPFPGSAGKEGPGSTFTRDPSTDTPFLPSACLPPGHLGCLGRGDHVSTQSILSQSSWLGIQLFPSYFETQVPGQDSFPLSAFSYISLLCLLG